ncbi:ATP-binding cassette domain-containing protein [Streptomyces sp. NPDC000410]|uniref:ATP-binding cassette domain-containing protein n=1 Tax=Streptomyces sp. NPDC000410 TaxID=3154254 RepID=UPI0033306B91
MIRFENVSVTYADAASPTVEGVDVTVPEGELVLLVGPSGVGKSTLLGAVSGLVPHFTGGTLRGRVTVDGRDTRTHKPRELADLVGTVGQDPAAHFVTDTVEDELAYGMESLGLAPDVMRRRVEETLDLLGLADLRDRPIATLSGGQRQRVAIGSVLTPHPKVLILDEPTSALDPAAAEEVLAVLQRLVHDLGTTVLMAEHRLERVVQYADQVILLPGTGAAPVIGPPADIMALSPVHPPVVALGRLAGWSPLPLSVREARRRAEGLRGRLSGAGAGALAGAGADAGGVLLPAPRREAGTGEGEALGLAAGSAPTASEPADGGASRRTHHRPAAADGESPTTSEPAPDTRPARVVREGTPPGRQAGRGSLRPAAAKRTLLDKLLRRSRPAPVMREAGRTRQAHEPAADIRGLTVRRGRVEALRGVGLRVTPGETVALMGRNGAGKSTLLGTLVGTITPTSGTVLVQGRVPHRTAPPELIRHVGLVPQEPRDLLYADTVAAECAAADADAGAAPGTCRALVAALLPGVPDTTHPRDLSEGQRLALALALVLTARPPLLLLDEPTRGLDYAAKARLVTVLKELAADGHAIVLATHDVELAAELAHRVVILADGEVVADGPTAEVVVSSPAFAPQVAKILAPEPWLTVAQVEAAL